MARLTGMTAVVTAGGTGIGLGAARRFVEEGAFVYITGRRAEVLDAAVAELGPDARAVPGSASDFDDLDALFDRVRAEREGIDILLANAGTAAHAALGEITADHYDRTFDLNVRGVVFTVQKALPLMRPGGSIILTGSTTGVMGSPAFSIYSATKAAVRNLARSWALDLRERDIRVNVLSPGPIRTGLAHEVLGDEGMEAITANIPLGRMGDPAETGAAAAFLASSDSSFMTGGEIFVDGGFAQI